MENMENMDSAPPGAAAQNLVGSVESMSFMDHHASAVSKNSRSMDASMKPPISTSKLFPNATPARSNIYQAVSSQPTNPPIHSDMYIAASTAMETFQSDVDDVKEDV
jgi:hypothetical protein